MISPRVASPRSNQVPTTKLTPNAKAKPPTASLAKTVTAPGQPKLPQPIAATLSTASDTINISRAAQAAVQSSPAERFSSCPCESLDPFTRADQHPLRRIKQHPATLSGIQKTLFGQSGQSDVNHGTTSVKAEFLGLGLPAEDSSKLLDLVRSIIKLPPESEVTIQGTTGDQPFEVKVEIKEDMTEVEIDGLTFLSQQAVESLLTDLRKQGVAEATVQGFTNSQKVEAQFQVQEGKGELKLEGFMFTSQDQALALQASFKSLGFNEIMLKGNVDDQPIELAEVTQSGD